ncbi:biotin-independent malonate decarboxylase subunit beta [Sporosarcina sp. P18a]|uniref:biotin-independent malonate decarboxylase subunit beta n=1 Tax=Sporosarcina sp. P18a TaxID=2048259 RepID=UPI000C172B17|nr:biotin-independent malonate decarboxylase subunit beta [Sporosarcina sp. P18a]PIC80748.1 biotin-independent malonate decarboxylase subunit beta [Sporosarcina sp. P18a]
MSNMLQVSLVESKARERAQILLDEGSMVELLGPFDGFESPHLEAQNIVPQSDDGMVIAKGTIAGKSTLIISIEGNFQGGGIGEVSGAKFAGALERALEDCENGHLIYPIIIYDTGGVRLQEANYGLLSIAEISSAIVAIKKHVPVIGIIPGKIGSFGGMSLTAGLCSALIMTREGRLGMNGPEVVEQEAGVRELNSKNKQFIWKMIGGTGRFESALIDKVVEDDLPNYIEAIESIWSENKYAERTQQYTEFLSMLDELSVKEKIEPTEAQSYLKHRAKYIGTKENKQDSQQESRGRSWFNKLTDNAPSISPTPSVLVADKEQDGRKVRYIAVVPNEESKFYRARNGEFGLEEAWTVAKYVREAIEEDAEMDEKRVIVPIVDVPGQAFGYHEELFGIYLACAASVEAYAVARQNGHPLVTLIVGKAISGAFLSHGMQSNRILSFDDEAIQVHVMSKKSAALVTMRTVEELDEFAKTVPSMAYDIQSFQSLGAIHELLQDIDADQPSDEQVIRVKSSIEAATTDILQSKDDSLRVRLTSEKAVEKGRKASIAVRDAIKSQWK